MSEKPSVKLGDWIIVDNGHLGKNAVVCHIYKDQNFGDVEVVYLDDAKRAINDNVVWEEDRWKFKHPGPSGGYADKHSRLQKFVRILRSERPK